MVIRNVTVNDCTPETIVIGRRGTFETMQVVFDLTYLIENYGDGTAVLALKRSQDSSAYPAVAAQNGNTLTWTVSETDTYYVGAGECQLMWYVDGGLAKTIIYPMVVMRDILATSEEAPDAYQEWVDALIAEGAETLQNAQNAAQSASDAESAKDDAVTAKEASENAQEAAEEAQQAAETAVTHYPKIVNNYWYVWANGEWVNTGVKAEGVDGRGIVSVTGQKTSTVESVDTYTMTVAYTSGNPDTFTFTVTNGVDGYSPVVTITAITGGHRVTITDETHPTGQSFDVMNGEDSAVLSVAGKTGNVTLNANDVAFFESGTYDDGTVGKELSDQKNAIDQKAPVIINTASGDIASFADGTDGMQIRKIVGTIVPVQDLHGQSAPYPAGGGINLLNPDATTDNMRLNVDGGLIAGNGWCVSDWIPVTENTNYFANNVIPSSVGYSMCFYDTNKSFLKYTVTYGGGNTVQGSGADAAYLRVTVNLSKKAESIVAQSSSYLPFSPYENICPISGWNGANIYNEETYDTSATPKLNINWQSSAGTIYGGSITLNEDRSADVVAIPGYIASYDGETLSDNYISSEAAPNTTPVTGSQVFDFGATPLQTYHFDNIGQLYTDLGTNNVWIDTGAITECDYPADTKLYVDGLTAPDEDMIANANIANGKYFVVNNQLYLSTAAIAAGASIVPGTNCTATSLAEALNAINT